MVKKVDCWYYIDTPGIVVKKAFVEALATVVLTNDLPNGMKFPLLVLIQEVSEEKLFLSLNCMCSVSLISCFSVFYLSFQVNQWGWFGGGFLGIAIIFCIDRSWLCFCWLPLPRTSVPP